MKKLTIEGILFLHAILFLLLFSWLSYLALVTSNEKHTSSVCYDLGTISDIIDNNSKALDDMAKSVIDNAKSINKINETIYGPIGGK